MNRICFGGSNCSDLVHVWLMQAHVVKTWLKKIAKNAANEKKNDKVKMKQFLKLTKKNEKKRRIQIQQKSKKKKHNTKQ